MAVHWRLRELLEVQGIPGAAGLQRALVEDLGLQMSSQAIAQLLRKPPELIKIKTAQMLSTFLQVPLHDFLIITPEPQVKNAMIIQPYRLIGREPERLFPDPSSFL